MTRRSIGSSDRLPYVIAGAWLVFTVGLATWWLMVGLTLASQLQASNALTTDFHRMFIWEGAVFISLLFAGGGAIVLAIRREHSRRRALETFFMSFTHDLKTALASIQLQAEGLREDWPEAAGRSSLDRLLSDAVRLQIQLENSLFVAQPDGRLLRERIGVRAAIARSAEDWPQLVVDIDGDADVVADARAFDTVMRNLLQNAVLHGGATRVQVELASHHGAVSVTLADNGRGVPAEAIETLGRAFSRPTGTSGTGVGLFVCSRLVSRMDGRLRFRHPAAGAGFAVELNLPGVR